MAQLPQAEKIEAIGLNGQMHGVVLADSQGQPHASGLIHRPGRSLRLTGAVATDPSDASATLLYNLLADSLSRTS